MRLLTILALCCVAIWVVESIGIEVLHETICVSLRTQRIPIQKIKTYTIKEGAMRAVIFVTKRGLRICADPDAGWTKAAITTLDKKNKKNKQKFNTTTVIPTQVPVSTNETTTVYG
ncbi:ORF8 [Rat cytomegalovirus ALL-03]|uniref:Viral Lymphotactin n=2 Tax=Rat cytomegalovirus (isolate England) TaxID=1261657 RepID=VXCL1_RCMVE|nr:e156.5 [Murid betaherpesvirus 8]K7XWG4.1 RecName: Full=Viral Lymphotactin; AltName: Full=Viral XCL1; Short=vSCL1; Flags: Precursor [Murid betaherpesvirus 8]AKE44308.1 ORF8 [Rat cytomegalovirus ALL-03]AFX83458.1 e156.5 [Murid betaherpesvirus 8]WEG71931.1 protein e155 [Murid betaherpesvirus 8]WPH25321.1 protein e155 [Murid betaherpesvirus 8]WPH25454.1 protein e155 [Murid betaherpesvirus 8]